MLPGELNDMRGPFNPVLKFEAFSKGFLLILIPAFNQPEAGITPFGQWNNTPSTIASRVNGIL